MKPYSRGPYNKFDDKEQWIRVSEGCPNNCEFCRETKECGKDPIYFKIPEIVRNKVKIMDMNLIYKPEAEKIINYLGSNAGTIRLKTNVHRAVVPKQLCDEISAALIDTLRNRGIK